MEQRKESREQRIRRCVFLILAYVVRANLLRQAIRDFLIKITGTTHDLGARRRCVFVYTSTNRPCNRYYIANNKITWIDKPRYKRLSPILVAVDVKGKKSNVLPSYRRGWSVLAREKNYYTCHVNAVNNVSRPLHSNLICEYLSSILFVDFYDTIGWKSVRKIYDFCTMSSVCNDNDFPIVCEF